MQAAPALLLSLTLSAAAQPDEAAARSRAGAQAMRDGRYVDAVADFRAVTELAPQLPGGWYALGQAYNAIKQDAVRSFETSAGDEAWRRLIAADAFHANGRLTDAFALYRAALDELPSMVTIHDSVARIYEATDHAAWAARERAGGSRPSADCASRTALCEFRAGRYQSALDAALAPDDPESRYWRARAANELALGAFARLDGLPDSRERRAVRATVARAAERYTEAIAELEAALRLAPGDPSLVEELASACYLAHDFERTVSTLTTLLQSRPNDERLLKLQAYALLQLRRLDEALPILQRAVARDPADAGARLALGRAHLQNGDFAAAVPLIEAELAGDRDGSLHVQLARGYTGLGQREKAAALLQKSEEIQRAAQERTAAVAKRVITPPSQD